MKMLILAAAAALIPAAALADDLSGTWKVHVNAQGRELRLDCHFLQQDKALGGTCQRPEGGDRPIPLKGAITGQNARWAYDGTFGGQPLHVAFNGNVEGSTIAGLAEVGGTRAPFEAVKQ
jgi:hypothetical protein